VASGLHAEAIGMTGWEWTTRRSLWVAFDVDSITSHAAGVGISKEELENVKQAVQSLPYVEVRQVRAVRDSYLYLLLCRGGLVFDRQPHEHAAWPAAFLA